MKYPQDMAPICKCGEYPSYEVLGKLYCEGCIAEIAEECKRKPDEYCEGCGDDSAEDGIRLYGDFYCRECFNKNYSI